MTDQTPNTHTYTAVFRLVRHAVKFAFTLSGSGWSARDIKQQGRTVTWTASPEDPRMYEMDMAETVGYYGSSSEGRATLNGYRTPISY